MSVSRNIVGFVYMIFTFPIWFVIFVSIKDSFVSIKDSIEERIIRNVKKEVLASVNKFESDMDELIEECRNKCSQLEKYAIENNDMIKNCLLDIKLKRDINEYFEYKNRFYSK